MPPRGFGVLTTSGRKTGKTRRKCVRAIRRGDRAYIVSIKGASTAWLKNVRANPNVSLRIRGGKFVGRAHELHDSSEAEQAREAYCGTVNGTDYAECFLWRKGRPTRTKIKELHRDWFDQGIPLMVELESG